MRLFAIACALLLASSSALAGRPSDAQLDDLMRVMRVREQMEGSWPQIEAQVRASAEQSLVRRGRTLDADSRREFDAMLERTTTVMRSGLAWNRVEPVFRDVYRNTFEADDITTIVDFYESPAGQRLLERMPKLVSETMRAVNVLVAPMLEDIERELAGAPIEDGSNEDESMPAVSAPAPPLPPRP